MTAGNVGGEAPMENRYPFLSEGDFIRVMGHAPDHFRRYNEAYGPLRFDNHLGPRLTEIVRLNVARTTRCQVCVAGRVPAATEAGLTDRISLGSSAKVGVFSVVLVLIFSLF
jgi:AhpD family alkylhydroperoxidase